MLYQLSYALTLESATHRLGIPSIPTVLFMAHSNGLVFCRRGWERTHEPSIPAGKPSEGEESQRERGLGTGATGSRAGCNSKVLRAADFPTEKAVWEHLEHSLSSQNRETEMILPSAVTIGMLADRYINLTSICRTSRGARRTHGRATATIACLKSHPCCRPCCAPSKGVREVRRPCQDRSGVSRAELQCAMLEKFRDPYNWNGNGPRLRDHGNRQRPLRAAENPVLTLTFTFH